MGFSARGYFSCDLVANWMEREMPTDSWILYASILLLAFSLSRKVGGTNQEGDQEGDQGGGNNEEENTSNTKQKVDINPTSNNVPNGLTTTATQPKSTTGTPHNSTCANPPADACANINIEETNNGNEVSTVAKYTCKSPYKMTGQQSLVCLGMNSWNRVNSSEDWPSCKVDCGPAPNEPAARVSAGGYGSYNRRVPWVTYTCDKGYVSAVSPSNTNNATCDPYTLEWTLPNLHCTAQQNHMTASLTFTENSNFLVDGNNSTCVPFTHSGSAIITFSTATQVYNITILARSFRDISLNITLTYINKENANWIEDRIPNSAWAYGKVFPWVDRGAPFVGTSLSITVIGIEEGTQFSLCEVGVTGRSHLDTCTLPPSPRYGQQLKGVRSGRCDWTTGFCSNGAQVEYECQEDFVQTSGDTVITCEGYRNWSNLTLQCRHAPVVILLQNSTDESRCTPVNKLSYIFTTTQLELQFAVVSISVEDISTTKNITAQENWHIMFEYLLSTEKYIDCDDFNLTIGTALYTFDCPNRPVPRSVRLKFTKESVLSSISICFIKVIARNYDKALECVQVSAPDYKGRLNYAHTGETCDFWSSHLAPNETIKGESLESAANFCRNRNNARSTPWCYVNGTATSCPVVMCNEACVLPWSTTGAEYVGQQNFEMQTRMSWKCIGWNVTSQADTCPVLQKSTFADSNPDTNYCRNPDRRTGGPWCNVRPCLQDDCEVREMACGIPTCPNTDQMENRTINVLNETEKVWFLTASLVNCWVYKNGSIKRNEMPRVQPVSMDAIDTILNKWCQISNGHNVLATCYDSSMWFRILLLCEINISDSVQLTESSTRSIVLSLSAQHISSIFIEETHAKDSLISPSTVPLYYTTRQTQESVSSHNWYRDSADFTQTVVNPGPMTTLHSEITPSSQEQTVIPGSLGQITASQHGINLNPATETFMQTVVNLGPMTTVHSEIRPSSSSAHEHISTRTVIPVSLGQTTALQHGINLNSATETTFMQTVVNPRPMTTLQIGIISSTSSTFQHISTQTATSANFDQTTVQYGIYVNSATAANSTQNVTPANRGQTTTLQSGWNPSSSPTPDHTTPKNHCPCRCSSDTSSDSVEESAAKAVKLSQFLQVHRGNLSSITNGKISKDDKRASARLVSLFPLVLLIMLLSLLILPDILSVGIYMSQRCCRTSKLASVSDK